ncbi:MAG TPA: GNAT family protein [Ensifer sp.]|nr:GNAT family protein [Ensifer sp.]
MIVWEPNDVIAGWMGGKIGVRFSRPFVTVASVDQNGKIECAALFNAMTDFDVECSVVVDGRATVELLKACREYVEGQLKRPRITFRTRASNIRAHNALKKLGADQEGRLREYFGDEDALIYGLILRDCKYGIDTQRA